jgi:hypothetical protein
VLRTRTSILIYIPIPQIHSFFSHTILSNYYNNVKRGDGLHACVCMYAEGANQITFQSMKVIGKRSGAEQKSFEFGSADERAALSSRRRPLSRPGTILCCRRFPGTHYTIISLVEPWESGIDERSPLCAPCRFSLIGVVFCPQSSRRNRALARMTPPMAQPPPFATASTNHARQQVQISRALPMCVYMYI